MSHKNIFDESFDKVSKARSRVEHTRSKVVEGVIELNEFKRIYQGRQKELTKGEVEISKLKSTNQNLKNLLIKAFIEREELIAKKSTLTASIDKLREQLEKIEEEVNSLLEGDYVERVCEEYSTQKQLNLLSKIHDAQKKLMKYGP